MNTTPTQPESTPPGQPGRLTRIAKIVVVLVVIGLIVGFVPRWISRHRLLAENHADSAITVDVISPVVFKPDLGTPLPAEVQAITQASIHARASGYLKNWFVDIGDHVTNNQVLAEIETPEVDQQLAQARAGNWINRSRTWAWPKSAPTAGRICSKVPASANRKPPRNRPTTR